MVILKIAFRNVIKNKWRSALIGFTLFISSFFLLFSNAAINGIEVQVIRGYINYQSGHVAVMWPGMKEVSPTDPVRFLDNLASYDHDNLDQNLIAIDRLGKYLTANENEIEKGFPSIIRQVRYSLGDQNDRIVVYGLTQEHAEFLQQERTLAITAGSLPASGNPGVAISEYLSEETGLAMGDKITLRAVTADKAVQESEFTITGLYANGAPYDNSYAFMTDECARELTGVPQPLFDIYRIYLPDRAEAGSFAKELEAHLDGTNLHAESYLEASPFYTNNSRLMRIMSNIFMFFLLIVIAMGLVATIRMNLFERIKEFGTMRAIGYSRGKSYGIIFAEMFILAALALAIALLAAGILVAILGQSGIYVGSGPASYGIGGERFWPELKVNDIILSILAITFFSLFATMGPGLSLCYQEITDMMLKRQRRIFLPGKLVRQWKAE